MTPSVLVIGAGPAGLAAAAALAGRGHRPIVVDREPEPGGIPRLCPHPTFGLADALWPMTGPAWARRLGRRAAGVDFRPRHHRHRPRPRRHRHALGRGRRDAMPARRILIATGIRETPRSARLVSGDRPLNVLTTGALQRLIALGRGLPFSRPVVVGSELVSFSAALMLRDLGAPPIAMVEEAARITARRPADLVARLILRVPVLTAHRLVAIRARPGRRLAPAVVLRDATGAERELPCDAVVFTGRFVPEASLLPGLDPATGGPAIDQCWRLARRAASPPATSSAQSKPRAGPPPKAGGSAPAWRTILWGGLPVGRRVLPIARGYGVKLVVPQRLTLPLGRGGLDHLQLRVDRPVAGELDFAADGVSIWRRRAAALPQRRLLIPLQGLIVPPAASSIEVGFRA